MKKTNYKVCVGKQNGYDIYRIVLTDGNRFFVKWNNKIIDVTQDIKEHRYIYK